MIKQNANHMPPPIDQSSGRWRGWRSHANNRQPMSDTALKLAPRSIATSSAVILSPEVAQMPREVATVVPRSSEPCTAYTPIGDRHGLILQSVSHAWPYTRIGDAFCVTPLAVSFPRPHIDPARRGAWSAETTHAPRVPDVAVAAHRRAQPISKTFSREVTSARATEQFRCFS